MSEFKKKRVFSEPLDNQDKHVEQELNARLQFDETSKFVPTEAISEIDKELDLNTVIKSSTKSRWGAVSLIVAFSGLVVWQTVDAFLTAFQSGDWLAFGWSTFVAALASVGLGFIGKELWKLKRLRQQLSSQDIAQTLYDSDQIGKAKPFCTTIAQRAGINELAPSYDRWVNAIKPNHSDQDVLQMYDSMVLKELDKKAKELITRSAGESALLVAISPLATADMVLVAWRNFKLIDQLATLYGVELGYWSRLKLLKLVLLNMAAAGATELVADASMDLLSMDIAGKVSTRAAQGIGVGLLSARLGIRAMDLLRPIKWQENEKMKLGEIKKGILVRLSKFIS